MCLPESNRFVPACSRSIDNRLWHKPVGNLVGSDAVLVHDAKHRLTILRVSLECFYSSTSNSSSSLRNFIRLSEARLQLELSTCINSEHGLLALIRDVLEQVCQSLIVVSYWMPGSAHSQAACAISRNRSLAGSVSTVCPLVTPTRFQSLSSMTEFMKSSVTRTELLAFWYWIE